eukprot:3140289-Amphidinium_carterae.1
MEEQNWQKFAHRTNVGMEDKRQTGYAEAQVLTQDYKQSLKLLNAAGYAACASRVGSQDTKRAEKLRIT